MSINSIQKAITAARSSLSSQLPTFFVVPKDKDEAPRTVALVQAMQNEMRKIATSAIEMAASLDHVEYDPDHRIVRGEQVLLVPDNKVNDESDVFDIVENLDSLVDLHAIQLVDTPIKMYGLGFGTTPDKRILFVRRKPMGTITAAGKLIAIAGGDALRAIKQPGVIIDRVFDLIVFPQGIVAFDSLTFEQLVKDPADVSAELRKNANDVAKFIPFASGKLKELIARGEKKPMIRRKLRSIVERNHLVGVTINEIKSALKAEVGSSSKYVTKDVKDMKEKLDFNMSDAMFILEFLDEGTWRGWRSKTHYAAGGRSVVK